jgi:hypothetical protein
MEQESLAPERGLLSPAFMVNMNSLLVIAFLLLAALPAKESTLTVEKVRDLDIRAFQAFGTPHIDANGNVYVHAATVSYRDSSFIKLSPSDGKLTVFKLSEEIAPGSFFEDFFVSSQGDLYLLVGTRDGGSKVFRFDSDGEAHLVSTLVLPKYVRLRTLGVFPSQTFFASGYYKDPADASLVNQRFAGIFDKNGKMIRDLTNIAGKIDVAALGSTLYEGATADGADGSLYFLSSNDIFKLNDAGVVSHRSRFKKAEDSERSVGLNVQAGTACVWLMTELKDRTTQSFQLIDVAGKNGTYGHYNVQDDAGIVLGCDRKEIQFLHNEHGQFSIVTARIP